MSIDHGSVEVSVRIRTTRWTSQKYTLGFYRNSQSILRLHSRAICHMNGNFVGFQNMFDFKRPDYE